jgi:8-amino-7-oxononanoate synthase
MNTLDNSLLQALRSREEENSLRRLVLPPAKLIDFASNDYLGLSRSQELFNIIQKKLATLEIASNGSTGSRLLTGNSPIIEQAEKTLADIFNAGASLLFPSGYMANMAVLSALPKRGDTILYDQFSHASIKDGLRLSQATRLPFLHNDLNDLERKIKKAERQCFVVVESVYSMDGDVSPLEELVDLCSRYNAHLIVDEAHSTGVMGLNGNGTVCQKKLETKVPVRIYTFGKAMGVHGACIAGSETLINYLINFSRPFIYTTAPDLHSVVSITESFRYLKNNSTIPAQLREKITFFLSRMKNHPQLIKSESAIQSFVIPGNINVKQTAAMLQQNGIDVRPIVPPTVAQGTERLRIILHSFNTEDEINFLIEQLLSLSSR